MNVQKSLRPVAWACSIAAFIAFICVVEGIGSSSQPAVVRALAPVTSPVINGRGFRENAVYPTTDASRIPAGITVYGSWLGSDASTGSVTTAWYDRVRGVSMMVAGYPEHSHIKLVLEVRGQNWSHIIQVTSANPKERWTMVTIPLPVGTEQFRIRAVDAAKSLDGWVGFSEPFSAGPDVRRPTFGLTGLVSLYVAAALCGLIAIGSAIVAWNAMQPTT